MLLRDFLIKRLVGCLLALVLSISAFEAFAWEFAHGDRDNSGFANVVTAPAGKGSVSVPNLGKLSPGAGPVIAPDGTVYLATQRSGKLIALHADGSPFWSRDITPGESIFGSPAIGSDGSIYVVGVSRVRDNSVDPPKDRFSSTLHRFTSSGGWIQQTRFPTYQDYATGAVVAAPPNIWRSGGTEAIILPAVYRHRNGGHTTRLIAFSPDGRLLDDKVVVSVQPQVLGGSGRPDWVDYSCLVPVVGWPLCLGYESTRFTPPSPPPMLVKTPPVPGVGIFTFAGGGTPFILVSDHYKDLVGYTFANQRLTEVFRVHENDFLMRTPPVILPDGHTLLVQEALKRDDIGRELPTSSGRIIFAKPASTAIAPVTLKNVVQAAPTRMVDGRVALVDGYGNVLVMKDRRLINAMAGAGRSMASAAASRTHIFVAGEDGLVTYDTNTLAEVARFDWVGGGLHPPAIGPQGHVYAIASNILFVFPPPIKKPLPVVGQPKAQPVATDPGPARPATQSYKPPMTPNGNRLFACEELDQDDCGKGDHREISLAWCQKQGYAAVSEYDVDSRTVKAETLDGRFCSKKTCKVFDEIACRN